MSAERFYDSDKWREQLQEWAENNFPHSRVQCTSVIPTLAYAVYAYRIRWSPEPGHGNDEPDLTALNESLRRTLGPLARLQQQQKQHELLINVMEMPLSAMEHIERVIRKTQKTVEANVKTPLKFYILLFVVLLVNFFVSVLLLHNHWYAYEEPWETPLQFIWYHLPFVGGSHTHQT